MKENYKEFFEKGRECFNKREYQKAIKWFSEAENCNSNGHSSASNLKGVIFDEIGELDKALESWTKAEKDSPKGYPEASYNKGIAYNTKEEFGKALESWTKAEEDSPDGRPEASYNKGTLYHKKSEFEKALESYTKAEEDSPDGLPEASFNKGLIYTKIGELEKALESWTKAEEDSPNGDPVSCFNKGFIYGELGELEKALESWTKAEEDSPRGYPEASYRKGIAYYNVDLFLSTNSFKKGIKDKVNQKFPICHMWLSKCHYLKGDYSSAKKYAYMAINQDSRDYIIVEHVNEYYSYPQSQKIYASRLNYLVLAFEAHLKTVYKEDYKINMILFNKILKNSHKPIDDFELLSAMLENKDVVFPTPITHEECFRLLYLIYFLKEDYHHVFYILDTAMDELYDHSPMDHYFYFLSAYLIGEPVSELRCFLDYSIEAEEKQNEKLAEWSKSVQEAIHKESYLDSYLLDVSVPDNIVGNDQIWEGHHKWINAALEAIKNPLIPYRVPLTKNELIGLLPQLLSSFGNISSGRLIYPLNKWENIKKALDDIQGREGYSTIVENIREGIQKGVPYSTVLAKIMEKYYEEEDSNKKHNLVILQAAVLFSERIDHKKEMPIKQKIAIDALKGLALDGAFYLVNFTFFGLSTAFATIVALSNHIKGKTREERAKVIFDSLKSEII